MESIMLETTKAVKKEAEEALIGSVLVSPVVAGELADVQPDDFYYPRHRSLWKLFKYLRDIENPMDLPSIVSALQDANKIEEVGGPGYLLELSEATPTAANARYYADIVKKAATLRRAMQTVSELNEKVSSASPDEAEKIIDEATRALEEARPDVTKGLRHIGELEEKVFDHLNKKENRVKTNFELFDKFSGGLVPGDLYILAGRPSVGKTAKMLQMAGGVARQEQGAVLIWSQEMDDVEILLRILSNETGVPYNFLTKDKDQMKPAHRQKLRERYKELRELPIYINDASAVSIDEINATIKQFKAKKGKIAAVFVDYLQIMDIKMERGQTEATAIGKVAQKAKDIARKEKFTFVLLSQMNRDVEEGDRKPKLRDLKGSGGIEQAADVVEFLYEHKNDLEEDAGLGAKWVRSLIAKGRNIGLTEIKCVFEGFCQKYNEIRHIAPGEDEKKERKKKGAA